MKLSTIGEFAGPLAAVVFAILFFTEMQNRQDQVKAVKNEYTEKLEDQKEDFRDSISDIVSQRDSLNSQKESIKTEFKEYEKQRKNVQDKKVSARIHSDSASVDTLYTYLTKRYGDTGIYIKASTE
jgi:septal ring factor EnvC (AmiA/AmiB activator)